VRAFPLPVVELNFEASSLALSGSDATRASLLNLENRKTDSKEELVPAP